MTTWVVPAIVAKVIDGDSLRLAFDLGWRIAFGPVLSRVAHINAPELADVPYGPAARDFVAALLPEGTVVRFTSHSLDKFGRPLGDVTLIDGRDLATLLVAAGHAVAYEGGPR